MGKKALEDYDKSYCKCFKEVPLPGMYDLGRRRVLSICLKEQSTQTDRLRRRLAAIPLPMDLPSVQEFPEVEVEPLPEIQSDSSPAVLGALTSAVVCAGCLIKRYYRAIKNTLTNPVKEL